MTETKEVLPDFDNPPVVEVALSIQFDPLQDLRTPQIGLLWNEFKEEFPKIEEHPPLDTAFERFGLPPKPKRPAVEIKVLHNLPPPRCWFLNKEGTQLIQIQRDRFIHNWRKRTGEEAYPRYENLRGIFRLELERFRSFIRRENLGVLLPNQCEVTYVNHVPLPEDVKHSRLNEILAPVTLAFSHSFLSQTEEANVTLRFVIEDEDGKPTGRLHVVSEPAYQSADGRPIYALTLTARGEPAGPTIEDAICYLDVCREWVVRGFAAVTTPKMHEIWERKS